MKAGFLFLLICITPIVGGTQSLSIDDLIFIQKSHDWEKIDSLLQRTGKWHYDSIVEPFRKTYKWVLDDTVKAPEDRDVVELTDVGHGVSPYALFLTTRKNRYQPLLADLRRKKYNPAKKNSVDRKNYLLSIVFWLGDAIAVQVVDAKNKASGGGRYIAVIMTRKDYDDGFIFDP